MIAKLSTIRIAAVALASLGAATFVSPAAHAQSVLFDWGGDESIGGAGKQSVRFPANYHVGELVVSFGDRKIYHVTGAGTANAYPIAIRRGRQHRRCEPRTRGCRRGCRVDIR